MGGERAQVNPPAGDFSCRFVAVGGDTLAVLAVMAPVYLAVHAVELWRAATLNAAAGDL